MAMSGTPTGKAVNCVVSWTLLNTFIGFYHLDVTAPTVTHSFLSVVVQGCNTFSLILPVFSWKWQYISRLISCLPRHTEREWDFWMKKKVTLKVAPFNSSKRNTNLNRGNGLWHFVHIWPVTHVHEGGKTSAVVQSARGFAARIVQPHGRSGEVIAALRKLCYLPGARKRSRIEYSQGFFQVGEL